MDKQLSELISECPGNIQPWQKVRASQVNFQGAEVISSSFPSPPLPCPLSLPRWRTEKADREVWGHLSGSWWSHLVSSCVQPWRWDCTCQYWGGWWQKQGWRWCLGSGTGARGLGYTHSTAGCRAGGVRARVTHQQSPPAHQPPSLAPPTLSFEKYSQALWVCHLPSVSLRLACKNHNHYLLLSSAGGFMYIVSCNPITFLQGSY